MVMDSGEKEHLTFGETELEEDVWQKQATEKQTISLQTAALTALRVTRGEQSIKL